MYFKINFKLIIFLIICVGFTCGFTFENPEGIVNPTPYSHFKMKDLTPLHLNSESDDVPLNWKTWLDELEFLYPNCRVNVKQYLNINDELIVPTKDDIFSSWKMALEIIYGPLNVDSIARLKIIVNTIVNNRNYYMNSDLNKVENLGTLSIKDGDLIESFYGRLVSVSKDKVDVLKINLKAVEFQTLFTQNSFPWKETGFVYKFDVCNGIIINFSQSSPINFGITVFNGRQLFVDGLIIDGDNLELAKDKELLEYVILDGELSILRNHGNYIKSHVVKDMDGEKLIMFSGDRVNKRSIVTSNGELIRNVDLKKNSVISEFGDGFLLLSNKNTQSKISVIEDSRIVIDNLSFTVNDNMIITDGSESKPLYKFEGLDYLVSADVTWDAIGNPIMLKVPKITFYANIRKVNGDTDEISGVTSDGVFTAEKAWGFKDRVGRGFYKLTIIDSMLVDAENLNSQEYKRFSKFSFDTLKIDEKDLFIDFETLVILNESEKEKEEVLREMKYQDFYDYWKNTLNKATVDNIEIFTDKDDDFTIKILKITHMEENE